MVEGVGAVFVKAKVLVKACVGCVKDLSLLRPTRGLERRKAEVSWESRVVKTPA